MNKTKNSTMIEAMTEAGKRAYIRDFQHRVSYRFKRELVEFIEECTGSPCGNLTTRHLPAILGFEEQYISSCN